MMSHHHPNHRRPGGLRQEWGDVLITTWCEVRALAKRAAVDRIGIVVMRETTFREQGRNAFELGRDYGRDYQRSTGETGTVAPDAGSQGQGRAA